MKLATFFSEMAPYLDGTAEPRATLERLYGPAGQGTPDARRLVIYREFCRVHRFQAVDSVYAVTRAEVVARAGEGVWSSLIEAYYQAHPMTNVELNENGSELAPFLAGPEAQHLARLPAWVAELAELEWWEWKTQNAPDIPSDLDPGGPLRLASTVELRRFGHDLVPWLAQGRTGEPEEAERLVLFWRDEALHYRRENASPTELWVLKAVMEGRSPGDAAETLQDLRDAGVIVGGA